MPHVDIRCFTGRTEEQKNDKALNRLRINPIPMGIVYSIKGRP